ncbi:MAG TPA: aromatic ring-hydroxylating dioxygenase subunit alpha, partial [Candidatus Limnocylindrales bacterium]|nr:aromatic ring-hydroxylating dioxygenase subunit alpha [Candidatus Limnocylindrales bacterium]
SFRLLDVDGENVILVRGRDDVIRAFYNVCRHRGTAVEERECGTAVRFQCPYHAWIYDLDGRLVRAKHTEDLEDFSFETFGLAPIHVATWQGFVFLNLTDGEVAPLEDQLGDLVEHFARFEFGRLRSAKRIDYEVAANWKFIAENYSECYHCPGVHPQLNKLTPYDLGGDFDPDGAWQGGWMELVGGAETMALDEGWHGSRGGRPAMCGITAEDEARIYYYVLWPLTFLSIHPDYLLVHRLVPRDAGHTLVICEWLFEEDVIAADGFDPSEPIAFWDLTNRQDWHVCELQQRGSASRSWTAGRYAVNEASVHAFDVMVADRYAGDGVATHRTVRERYDVPPPKVDPGHHHEGNGVGDDPSHHVTKDRHTARAKAAGSP